MFDLSKPVATRIVTINPFYDGGKITRREVLVYRCPEGHEMAVMNGSRVFSKPVPSANKVRCLECGRQNRNPTMPKRVKKQATKKAAKAVKRVAKKVTAKPKNRQKKSVKKKATPKADGTHHSRPASLIDHDLDVSIRCRIARLGGTLDGRKLYLDETGEPTFTAPKTVSDSYDD